MKIKHLAFAILAALTFSGCASLFEAPALNNGNKIDGQIKFAYYFERQELTNDLVTFFNIGEETEFGYDYIDSSFRLSNFKDDVRLDSVRSYLDKNGAAAFRIYERAVKANGNTLKKYSTSLNAKIARLALYDTLFLKKQFECTNNGDKCVYNEFPLLAEVTPEGKIVSLLVNFLDLKALYNNYRDGFTPTEINLNVSVVINAKLTNILNKISKKDFDDAELLN